MLTSIMMSDGRVKMLPSIVCFFFKCRYEDMYNSRVSEHFPYVFAERNFPQFTVTGKIPHEIF